MLQTTRQLKKGAIKLSEKQDKVLRLLLSYIKSELKHGYFLDNIDLDKYEFYWAPNMTAESGIQGMWSWTDKYRVYLANLSLEQPPVVTKFSQKFMYDFKVSNIFLSLKTCLHELYHSWQFKSSPILYLINFVVFVWIYDLACKLPFTIEGDVRVTVDNEETEDLIQQISGKFSSYVFYQKNWDLHSEQLLADKAYREDPEGGFYYLEQFEEYKKDNPANDKTLKLIEDILKIYNQKPWMKEYELAKSKLES